MTKIPSGTGDRQDDGDQLGDRSQGVDCGHVMERRRARENRAGERMDIWRRTD